MVHKVTSQDFYQDSGLVHEMEELISADSSKDVPAQELRAFKTSLANTLRNMYSNKSRIDIEFADEAAFKAALEEGAKEALDKLADTSVGDAKQRQKNAVTEAINKIIEKAKKIDTVDISAATEKGTEQGRVAAAFAPNVVAPQNPGAKGLADQVSNKIDDLLNGLTNPPEGIHEAVDAYKQNLAAYLETTLRGKKDERVALDLRPHNIKEIAEAALKEMTDNVETKRGLVVQRDALGKTLDSIIATKPKIGKRDFTSADVSKEHLHAAKGSVTAPSDRILNDKDAIIRAVIEELDYMKLADAGASKRVQLTTKAKAGIRNFLDKAMDPSLPYEFAEKDIQGLVAAIDKSVATQDLKNAEPVFGKDLDKGVIAYKYIIDKSGLEKDDLQSAREDGVKRVIDEIKNDSKARKSFGNDLGKQNEAGDKAQAAVESAFDKMKADSKGVSAGKAGEKGEGNVVERFAMKNPKTSMLVSLAALVAGVKKLISGESWVSKLFGAALVAGGVYAGVKGYQGYQASRDGGGGQSR